MLSKALFRASAQNSLFFAHSRRSMLTVNAALVKKLRDATGAPMNECKKALTHVIAEDNSINESECMVAANEYLRKRGSAIAASKAGRNAKDGVVVFAVEPDMKRGAVVEINCETDFVARNGTFMAFALRTALAALDNKSIPSIQDAAGNAQLVSIPDFSNVTLPFGPAANAAKNNADEAPNTISAELVDVITNCRENVRVRRASTIEIPQSSNGFIASYIHNELPMPEELESYYETIKASGRTFGVGFTAALAAFETTNTPSPALMDLGRKIAMQTVAANPAYLARENVPESVLEKEKEIFLAATPDVAGKDEKILANLIRGKMNKFYENNVLVDQTFIVTNDAKKPKVSQLISELDSAAKITQLIRLHRGEEIAGEEEAPAQE